MSIHRPVLNCWLGLYSSNKVHLPTSTRYSPLVLKRTTDPVQLPGPPLWWESPSDIQVYGYTLCKKPLTLVPRGGLEPPRPFGPGLLRTGRLPISSPGHYLTLWAE